MSEIVAISFDDAYKNGATVEHVRQNPCISGKPVGSRCELFYKKYAKLGTLGETDPKGKNDAGVAKKGFSDFRCVRDSGTWDSGTI